MFASDIAQNFVGVDGGIRLLRLCRNGSLVSVSLALSASTYSKRPGVLIEKLGVTRHDVARIFAWAGDQAA